MTASSNDNLPAVPERFEDADLRQIESFADAWNLLTEQGFQVENYADSYGSGFTICEDKRKLVDTHLIMLQWNFSQGSFGEFVSAAVVTESGDRFIVNDGSTGLCQQLVAVTMDRVGKGMDVSRAKKGLELPRGLRVSSYVTHASGKPVNAATDLDTDGTCPQADCQGGKKHGTGETFYLAN